MARPMHYRDYAFEAYARSRAKRDRGKREGPDHQINGVGAQETDQLGGRISFQNTECELDRQLDDENWFRRYPKASFRLRDLNENDGHGESATELLSIIVSRGGRKTFIPRVSQ
jgi:hypothetical protein